MSDAERILELEELVRYHADLYFNKNTPELSDDEFDELIQELKAMDPDNPVLSEVGAVPSYGKKVPHDRVMGSLDNAFTSDEAKKWHNEYASGAASKVALTPKMDGAACRLNYLNGTLIQAASRGDGEVGQDVTDNIRATKSIPNNLGNNFTGEVRGEVIMLRSVFEKLNQEFIKKGKKPFANPRNAASGSVQCQDPMETGERSLNLIAYDVIPEEDVVFATETEKRAYMAANLGDIELVDFQIINIDEFEEYAAQWEVDRPGLDFEIDGLVLALDSIDEQEAAGFSPNGKNNRGKVAYKFKPEQKESVVRVLDCQVGRTGRITPMSRIEPTYVAGSTLSNVTLHNHKRVKRLDIAVGDTVLIQKAGDIIPEVVRVVCRNGRTGDKKSKGVFEACPVCDGPLVLDEKEVSQWCENPACPAKLERRIFHWVKRLGVLGIGPAIIHNLCEAGFVKSLPDIYFINQDQARQAAGGERAGEKAIEALLGVSEVPLWKFLAGLGIHGIGRTTSKDIAKEFKTLEAVRSKTSAEFKTIGGIGKTTGPSAVTGLVLLADEIDRLIDVLDIEDVEEASGPLVGKSFCLTGALPSGTKRSDMEAQIEAAGGEVKKSVGKGLTYLVLADPTSTSAKAEKARKLGTECIAEDELVGMIG